jgi:hypothetical protein
MKKGINGHCFLIPSFQKNPKNTLKSAYLKYLRSNGAYQKQNQEES